MTRYALGVEYDGGGFLGWQRLSKSGTPDDTSTVQAALEGALSSVADARVDTICAGRTDAGVHAQCQVVHFDSDAARRSAYAGASPWPMISMRGSPRARGAIATRW